MKSKFFTSIPYRQPYGEDCYDLAQRAAITPEEAAKIQEQDHLFTGWNDFGNMNYITPEEEETIDALKKNKNSFVD